MKRITTAGLAVAALLGTSTVASAQALCVLPLFLSAAVVSAQENRELTQKEAMWCGLVREEPQKRAVAKKTTVKKTTAKKTSGKKTTAQ